MAMSQIKAGAIISYISIGVNLLIGLLYTPWMIHSIGKENTKPSPHPKIKVAAVREYPYELARQNEIELHELSFTVDDMEIVRKMKEIVPEYKPIFTKYQTLNDTTDSH